MASYVQVFTELFSPCLVGEGILLQPPIDFGHKYSYNLLL